MIVLGLIEILLRRQDGREIPRPLLIFERCDAQSTNRRHDAAVQIGRLRTRQDESGNAVLDLLLRLEDRILIIDEKAYPSGSGRTR